MGRKVRWDAETLAKLVAAHTAEVSVADLAVYYKVSKVRIYQLLKQAGVVVRGQQANLGPVTEAAIIQIEEATNAN